MYAAVVVGARDKQFTIRYKLSTPAGKTLKAGDKVPASAFDGAIGSKIFYSPKPAIGAVGGDGTITAVNTNGTYAITLDADIMGQVIDNATPAEIEIIIDTDNLPLQKDMTNIRREDLRLDFTALPNARVCKAIA